MISTPFLFAQKKALDHSVYDSWKSLEYLQLTHDGKYAISVIKEQEGDDRLLVRETVSGRELILPRGYACSVTPDQKRAVALIKPPFEVIRQAKIKKTAAEKMPKDSLAIIRLDNFSVTKIANVSGFKIGKDFSEYIACTLSDTVKTDADAGKTLLIRHLHTGQTDTVKFVTEYLFSRNGKAMIIAIHPKQQDSAAHTQIMRVNLDKYGKQIISRRKERYKQLAISESGNKAAFLATSDPKKQEIKEYQLYYFRAGADSASVIADKTTQDMPLGWLVSEHHPPGFSRDETRLFFGIAPAQTPKDTIIPDFEKASLDVWHWKEPLIQPQQLVELKRETERSYLSFIDLKQPPGKIYQLATQEIPHVTVSDENNGRYALGVSNLKYIYETTWNSRAESTYDIWVFDLAAHTREQIKTGLTAEYHFSPKGNYLAWYNMKDSAYHAYALKSGKEVNLTGKLNVNFWNEKNDRPMLPGSYGTAVWTEDEKLMVYDAFDLWKLDTSGDKPPENVTGGTGRKLKTRLRYFRTDPESRFVTAKEKMMFTAFDETSKEKGFYEWNKSNLKLLVMDKFTYSIPVKAKNKEVYLYVKSNFNTSPDLYVTSDGWKSERRLSDINPQMKDYNWGTAELVSWVAFDGKPTEGIVYKPEDFDPGKKYPMIVYFYEKLSDNLYTYIPPVPSRSIVNIPFFCSRGYVVFTPDIYYITGHPGESAYNSIVSGVEKLCENEWIDRDRMALQGQSWGGYQTAYLITRTDMFRAASAGALVSNMFSAYGGIRWSTGVSRQFQYEQTQSRIGKTVWEAPELYYENSPLFFADKVKTPLLIMHNDKDGAVPWYQGIEYFMALRRLEKPVWMLQYNGEEHNLTERRNSKDLSIRLQQFLDHYLKDAPMPVWMKEGVPALKKGRTYGLEYE
ncbi:MAG: prolyl oligopeptidase family serine peptidase [Bacteroidales bacterium]|nr:prolyl oligopeptidase family serine peptidase [Bacteroidales bacterium]